MNTTTTARAPEPLDDNRLDVEARWLCRGAAGDYANALIQLALSLDFRREQPESTDAWREADAHCHVFAQAAVERENALRAAAMRVAESLPGAKR